MANKVHYKRAGILPWALFFLIWPLGSFCASLWKLRTAGLTVIVILFYSLYGYTYIISGKDQDTYRIAQYFKESSEKSFSDIIDKFLALYNIENKPDIFQDILQFLVSRFTDNQQIYFALIAGLLAFMAGRLIHTLLTDYNDHREIGFFAFVSALFIILVVLSPMRINSFRHYFATALFLYGSFRYLRGDGRKYLFVLLATPLVHFAFILILPLLFLYKIFGTRFTFYYLLIILSFVFASDTAEIITLYNLDSEGNALQYHAGQYMSEGYRAEVQQLKAQRYYLLDTYAYFTTILLFSLTVICHLLLRKKLDKQERHILAFGLLIFGFVNLFSDIDSVSNRFGVLYQGFTCVLFIFFQRKSERIIPNYVTVIFFLVFVINLIIVSRILIQSASISLVLLLSPVAIIYPLDTSILDLIK